MGDQLPSIEFIDPHEEPGDEPYAIAWLDADDEPGTQPREGRLPPHTTMRRTLASLLVFGLALSITGFAGAYAYRHDQAIELAADTLILGETRVGDPVTLLETAGGGWRIDPSATVAVDVTNESPDSITLLPDATLTGSGLSSPATLRPSGVSVIKPGQSGRLVGTAKVNCGVSAKRSGGGSVLVPARTANGAVGAAEVDLDGGGESIRQEICVEQGQTLASSTFPVSVDATAHTFTVRVATRSLTTQPLPYRLVVDFSGSPTTMPDFPLSAPVPIGDVSGTLAGNARLNAGYTVRVTSCPTWLPTARTGVDLQLELDYRGTPAVFQEDGFDLGTLVGAACGLIS